VEGVYIPSFEVLAWLVVQPAVGDSHLKAQQ